MHLRQRGRVWGAVQQLHAVGCRHTLWRRAQLGRVQARVLRVVTGNLTAVAACRTGLTFRRLGDGKVVFDKAMTMASRTLMEAPLISASPVHENVTAALPLLNNWTNGTYCIRKPFVIDFN